MKRRLIQVLLLVAAEASAQQTAGDSLRLSSLHAEAVRNDPRLTQLLLIQEQSALRQRAIDVDRLPSFSIEGLTQYQSDVTTIGASLPQGIRLPTPSKATDDASLYAQQRIFDPSLATRRSVERASLNEASARVRVVLHQRRQEVNDAYFTALLLQYRAAEIDATTGDLEAQREVVEARVREGSALPSEAASLRASILRRRQDAASVRADRSAALAVLGRLVNRPIGDSIVLSAPELSVELSATALDTIRARPEHSLFARQRERLQQEAEATSAREKPTLSAFARAGYGRPGLNVLSDRFDSYWLAGLRVRWTPFTWNGASRERQLLQLQERILDTEEAAFTDALRRALERDRAAVTRFEAMLPLDDEIIGLRERIERETRARLREGVVTVAEYVDRRNDVLEARLARSIHLTELAQARARILTTLGLEIP